MRFGRNPRTASRLVDHRMMVVDVDGNRLFALNGTASRVWQSLAEPRTIDDLARELGASYQVDEERARGDCRSFCEDLVRRGLLVSLP